MHRTPEPPTPCYCSAPVQDVDEETREKTLLSPIETGAGVEEGLLGPAARPSPLRSQLYSPFAQEPSPSTGNDHHLESFDVAEGEGGPSAEGVARSPPSSVAAAGTEESRPPLHGNNGGFRGHAPPGVRVVESTPTPTATTASAAAASAPGVPCSAGGASSSSSGGGGGKGREGLWGSSDGGYAATVPSVPPPPRSSHGGEVRAPREPKLRVCTPTGDGGTSDLSLWVTLRDLEEAEATARAAAGGGGRARPFLSLSPVTPAGHARNSAGGGRFSSSSAGGGEEAVSSGGAAKSGSEAVEEGGGRDATVGVLSSEDPGSGGGTADQYHTSAGRRTGKGTGTRIVAVAAGSAATAKTGPAGGGGSSFSPGDGRDVSRGAGVAGGGVVGLWRSLSQALGGLLDFCHPHQGGGGGDGGGKNWCR